MKIGKHHKEKKTKTWYKRWWGIILVILIWPFFFIWYVWARTKWRKAFKILLTIPLAIAALLSLLIVILTIGFSTDGSGNSNSNSIKLTPAEVTSDVTDTLTTATNKTAQLMLDGKNAATQQDPLGANNDGPFSKWEKNVQSKTDSNTDDAYSSATSSYSDNGQSPSSILDTWKKDNYAAYQDISTWQAEEGLYLITLGGGGGKDATSQLASANATFAQFQTDLAKAEADIAKLSGQPFQSTVQVGNAPKASAPQPTTSVASLKAAAVSGFNAELTDLSNQMAQGQSLINQPDTCTIGGTFNNWSQSEQHDQNVKNNGNVTSTYNTATNAFYNAHQQSPAALDNWDSDAGNVVSDITQWADAENTICADQVSGDSSLSSDQQTADSDYQHYQSDLAKAQADIKQLQ